MDVFITGGTGFIGSNLVEALNQRGIVPRLLRRESSSLKLLEGLEFDEIIGDILDPPESLADAMAGCGQVFHVAALSDYRWQDPEVIYKVNVDGTKNMLSAAIEAEVDRFIFTSSLSALGIPDEGTIMDENSEFNLEPHQFPYGHSKYLAEIEVRNAVAEGLEAVILNPSGVIGPRGVSQTVGALFVEAANGRLRFYPPGGMNVVAVGDVVACHLSAAETGIVGENYIVAGDNVTYREAFTVGCEVVGQKPPIGQIPAWLLPPAAALFSILYKVFGDKVPLEANQIRLAGRKVYADGGKAVRNLGIPQTPFRIAVQQAYDWYLENGYVS